MNVFARAIAIGSLVLGMCGVSGAQQRPDAARIRQQLIGSYKLISYVSYDQNAAERKMPYVHGQISYDAAGRMSAQLMGSDRPQFGGGQAPGAGGAGGRGAGGGQGQAADASGSGARGPCDW